MRSYTSVYVRVYKRLYKRIYTTLLMYATSLKVFLPGPKRLTRLQWLNFPIRERINCRIKRKKAMFAEMGEHVCVDK